MNDVKETVVRLMDGKYELRHEHGRNFRALRYGEPWRDLTGDGMVLALVQRIEELEEATLKAAQGGVTEAMVERACNAYFDALPVEGGESANRDAMRAALEAALSAEPAAQGEADACSCCGRTDALETRCMDCGEIQTVHTTAPPAQPAERVPEGFLTIGTRVLWEDNIGRKWPATITGYNPATYNAELDDGTDALGYARGRFTVDAAAPAPSPARGTAWCPKCAANQPHHTDPSSSGCLHLCDVCNSVVEY